MTDAATDALIDDTRARRNVFVLAAAHAILGVQLPTAIVFGGLAGSVLATNKALATLPISIMVISVMICAAPASMLMGRIGRRAGFLVGAAAGAVGAALSVAALYQGAFWMLLLGAVFTGIYQAFQGFFRFAAADTASEAYKPKAISWVLAGGLFAALLGGEVARWTHDLLAPIPFAGAYLAVVGLSFVGAFILLFLDIPTPPRVAKGGSDARPLSEIFRQPEMIVAVICGMVSYALMNLVMTSTPLAMVGCGYDPGTAADVVRWHAVAMFGPSFFTGSLIARFGHYRIISIGLILLGSCALVALSGVELEKFYIALILLGLGWNFGFIGATSLVATLHRPSERASVQGLNDFLVFGLVSVASLSSGVLMNALGWNAVNLAVAPFLALAGGALIWITVKGRRVA